MATKNIVPRADKEGELGSSSKRWNKVNAITGSFEYIETKIQAMKIHNSGSTEFGNTSDDKHTFTGTVNITGNVGIGTTSPQNYSGYSTITINHATHGGVIQFRQADSNRAKIYSNGNDFEIDSPGEIKLDATTNIDFTISEFTKMRMLSNGSFGIGTTSPDHKLSVIGDLSASINVSASGFYGQTLDSPVLRTDTNTMSLRSNGAMFFYIDDDGNDTNRYFKWFDDNTVRMQLDDHGDLAVDTDTFFVDAVNDKVGINTNSGLDYALNVVGDISASGDFYLAGGDIRDSGGQSRIQVSDDANTIFRAHDGTPMFTIGTNYVQAYGDMWVDDFLKPKALRVGSSMVDPGDGNFYVEGTGTFAGNVSASINISASGFYGDGSTLSNITTSPAGSSTHVQYNNGGAFAGSANLLFDGTKLTSKQQTIHNESLNALTDVGAIANYHLYLRCDDNTDQSAGIALGSSDNVGAAIIYKDVGGYGRGRLEFYTKSSVSNSADPVQRMVITEDGEVGINKVPTTGLYKFEVDGKTMLGDTTLIYDPSKNVFSDVGIWTNYHLLLEGGTSTNDGIGLGFINDDSIGASIIYKDLGTEAKGELQFYTKENTDHMGDPTQRMVITYDGKIGMGIASPSVALDVAGTGSFTGDLSVTGDLTVNGTTTTVNSTTLQIDDKNIDLAHSPGGSEGNDSAVDGGGITLKSSDSDKTLNWVNATDAWTSSEHIDLANGKVFKINNNEVLSATALNSAVKINNANWSGTDLGLSNGGTGASNSSGARTNLGVAIGSDVQAHDADLDTLSGMQSGAAAELASLTSGELGLLDGASSGNILSGKAAVLSPAGTLSVPGAFSASLGVSGSEVRGGDFWVGDTVYLSTGPSSNYLKYDSTYGFYYKGGGYFYGDLAINGDFTVSGGDIKDSGGTSRISIADGASTIFDDRNGNPKLKIHYANDYETSVEVIGNMSASINISASAFYGDGSNLTGIGGGSTLDTTADASTNTTRYIPFVDDHTTTSGQTFKTDQYIGYNPNANRLQTGQLRLTNTTAEIQDSDGHRRIGWSENTGNTTICDAGGGTEMVIADGQVEVSGALKVSAGTSGDAMLRLEADTDNNAEGDTPYIEFIQDGGSAWSAIYTTSNVLTLANSVASGGGIELKTNTSQASSPRYAGATTRMKIMDDGKVGVGTTSPAAQLHIDRNATVGDIGGLTLGNATVKITDEACNMYLDGNSINMDNAGYINVTATQPLYFGTANARRMTIDSSGEVGIGENTPTVALAVGGNLGVTDDGSNKRISLESGTGVNAFIGFGEASNERGWIGWKQSGQKIVMGSVTDAGTFDDSFTLTNASASFSGEISANRMQQYISTSITAATDYKSTAFNPFDSTLNNGTTTTHASNGITYASSTGDFTIAYAGVYEVTCVLQLKSSTTASGEIDIEIRKNDSSILTTESFIHGSVDPATRTLTGYFTLAAADTIQISIDSQTSTNFRANPGSTVNIKRIA